MKKVMVSLVFGLMLTAYGTVAVHADAAEDIQALKDQIVQMQEQIKKLEEKQAAPAVAPVAAAPATSNVAFHGWFRGRLQFPQDAEDTSFNATEIAFQPSWDGGDGITANANLWFYPRAGLYIESAYVTYDGVGFGKNSKLVAGKARNFAYGITPTGPNRKISNYSIYAQSFSQSRIDGLQLFNNFDNSNVSLNVALFNGYTLRGRNTGTELWGPATNGTTSVLSVGENSNVDGNDAVALSFRLGGDVSDHWNLGLSGYGNKLAAADLAYLAGLGVTTTSQKHMFFGLDSTYKNDNFVWQTEASIADVADNDYWGFQTLVGYNFTPIDVAYLSYNQLDYDGASLANNTTWDKQQVSVSYKHNLTKKAWITLEHEFNMEDAPAATPDVDNDMTFIEYFVAY